MHRPHGFRGIFRDDDEARAVYSEAAGIARILPRAVAVPADADDVRALVRWAAETATALVPRGSGTSMAGGAIGPGVVVDLGRLRTIGAVDAVERRVAVGPGALRGEVNALAREHGLRFPVDPSSGAFCTIGGMAATNAAGAHTLRFGAMRAWVEALDCVFADGSRAVVRRGASPPDVPAVRRFLEEADPVLRGGASEHDGALAHAVRKESSGYAIADYLRSGDLVDLLVGSEGTLALFVGVELRLLELPGATSSLLAAFGSLDDAVRGAALARDGGASACELLDRTFLDVAAQGEGGHAELVPAGAEAALLVEVEGADAADAAASAGIIERAMRQAGASTVRLALDHVSEPALWSLRHAASPILARLDPALKSMQFIEDGAVPPERLADYVRGVRRALAAHDVRGVIFGHAGDAHVHVNPLVDVRRADWRDVVASLLDEVTTLAAGLGGTIAGEHGDGRLRTPLLDRVWRWPAGALFTAVKRSFDPGGILNPGVKVALPEQLPIGEIKYDPSLAPHPRAARRALELVERERGYARFRLELLETGTGDEGRETGGDG
jgi:FAD/FMN-containing dehydrogenase